MKQLLDPKVDFVFKRIFGSEKHPNILISFLNAVIKPEEPIVSVNLKDTDINKDSIKDKFSRLDVKAITSNGEHINIEIQLKNEHNMVKRSLYYWSKLYSEQLNEGEIYSELARTICINILNFKYLSTTNFHSCYRLKETQSHQELTDIQELHFIEIPKLPKKADITDVLVSWVEFLKDPNSEEVHDIELTSVEVREAKSELIRLSNDDNARAFYEQREKANKDRTSALEKATSDGLEEGIQKGIAQMTSKVEQAEAEKQQAEVEKQQMLELLAAKMGLSVDEAQKILSQAK